MFLWFSLKHGAKRNKEVTIDESSKKSMDVTSCKLGKKKKLYKYVKIMLGNKKKSVSFAPALREKFFNI
jgi:hypothetical protein